jgi:hypothetical protein
MSPNHECRIDKSLFRCMHGLPRTFGRVLHDLSRPSGILHANPQRPRLLVHLEPAWLRPAIRPLAVLKCRYAGSRSAQPAPPASDRQARSTAVKVSLPKKACL